MISYDIVYLQKQVGDSVFSTNNKVLIRRYKELPAINCIQHKAEKKIITEENIIQSNFNGFGNSVGSITNRATAMFSVQAKFDIVSFQVKLPTGVSLKVNGDRLDKKALDAIKKLKQGNTINLMYIKAKGPDGQEIQLRGLPIELR